MPNFMGYSYFTSRRGDFSSGTGVQLNIFFLYVLSVLPVRAAHCWKPASGAALRAARRLLPGPFEAAAQNQKSACCTAVQKNSERLKRKQIKFLTNFVNAV